MFAVHHMNTEASLKGLNSILLLEKKFLSVHILWQFKTNQQCITIQLDHGICSDADMLLNEV